jgi:pantoate--beta-alanine ligase
MIKISSSWLGSVGFVPTMGYLHEGHLKLVKTAKDTCDICIVSIYVNPAQFAPTEDLSSYPRDLDKDVFLLKNMDVDYLFFPKDEEMYPKHFKTWVDVDEITKILCGKSRPNHFRGVTTILTKLINLVRPDFMFMGEKDYQQLMVTKQMVADLNFSAQVIGCPIVREDDGLAMSSRNKYLSNQERKSALCLFESMQLADEMVKQNIFNCSEIKEKMSQLIEAKQGKIDYIEFVEPSTLLAVSEINADVRLILAVFIGKTRLIDNRLIKYGKS